MKNGRELTPENELQELWELNGRVKAVIAYLKTDTSNRKKFCLC